MTKIDAWDLIIIGGGLAGLTCALHLSNKNYKIVLLEKQSYPHHKVCGEYVSNEVLPYLNSLGIDPLAMGAKKIDQFEISNKNGRFLKTNLPLGGFGLSRFAFDNALFNAVKDNVTIVKATVESISFSGENFTVTTQDKEQYNSNYVAGTFGKRSNIDTGMKRKFTQISSPWLAVKAHYNYDFSENIVALHNFDGGYCGLSKTETNAVNACYLTTYKSFKRFGKIPEFQQHVLSENKFLKHFFDNAEPLFEKPLTISQISFDRKQAVEDHIIMIGDSAGLIHPLCGNGMAMAIHSAKLFSEVFIKHYQGLHTNRSKLETHYSHLWQNAFSNRLKTGRRIQSLLLQPLATSVGFSVAKMFPFIVPKLIKRTHGGPLV